MPRIQFGGERTSVIGRPAQSTAVLLAGAVRILARQEQNVRLRLARRRLANENFLRRLLGNRLEIVGLNPHMDALREATSTGVVLINQSSTEK